VGHTKLDGGKGIRQAGRLGWIFTDGTRADAVACSINLLEEVTNGKRTMARRQSPSISGTEKRLAAHNRRHHQEI